MPKHTIKVQKTSYESSRAFSPSARFRAKMAYFQTQGRGGQTHSNLKINIFFWFPTENYNRNHPLIRELVLVPPLLVVVCRVYNDVLIAHKTSVCGICHQVCVCVCILAIPCSANSAVCDQGRPEEGGDRSPTK